MPRSSYYSHNNKYSIPFKHNRDSSLLTILSLWTKVFVYEYCSLESKSATVNKNKWGAVGGAAGAAVVRHSS